MDRLIEDKDGKWDRLSPELVKTATSIEGGYLLSFLIGLANSKDSDSIEVSSSYIEERTTLDSRQSKYRLNQLKSLGLITVEPTAYNAGRKVTLNREIIRQAMTTNTEAKKVDKKSKDAFYRTLNETLSFHDLDALLDVKDNLDEVIVATLHYFALGYNKTTGKEWKLTGKDMGFLIQRQSELNRPMTIPSIASYFRSNPEELSLYGWWKFMCLLPEDSTYPKTREEWDRLFSDEEPAEDNGVSDFFDEELPLLSSIDGKKELKQFSRWNNESKRMDYFWGLEPQREAQFA